MQAETTTYFVVCWVLFEYSIFDHFPKNNFKHAVCPLNVISLTKEMHGSWGHLFSDSGRDWVPLQSSTADYFIRAIQPACFPMMQ